MKQSEFNRQAWQRNRLTRLGYHFLFVGSFALVGGALRGFNLLLILAGLIAGILMMHWRWSRRSLEGLTVSRRMPHEAYAGKPFRMGYQVHSSSRFLPVWMLRVEDVISSRVIADRDRGKWSPFGKPSDAKAKAVCGVGMIPPGKTRLAQFDCSIPRRGVYELGPVRLVSCFPLSLMTASKVFVETETMHVYPALLPLKATWSRSLTNHVGGEATSVNRNGGGRGEFFGLREWQSGDSTQLIHWRTTARTGVPAVRQFEQKRSFDVCFLLDAFNAPGGSLKDSVSQDRNGRAGKYKEAATDANPAFENAVSLAASLVCRMQNMASSRFVMSVAASEACVVQSKGQRGGGERSRHRILQLLASTEAAESPKVCEAIRATLDLVGRGHDMVIISTRSMSDAVDSDPDLKEALAGWKRQSVLRWINVQSSDLDLLVSGKPVLRSPVGASQ